MNIQLAKYEEIKEILDIFKERCNWFKKKNIDQWGSYEEKYNEEYFIGAMQTNKLYVVKQEKEVIGVFLLKEEDKTYWNDNKSAYYIHHLATRIGYLGVGAKILEFIEKLAIQNNKECIRLDCKKNNDVLNSYYQKRGFIYMGSGDVPYSYNLYEKKVL